VSKLEVTCHDTMMARRNGARTGPSSHSSGGLLS
jgi:hypothetical protein